MHNKRHDIKAALVKIVLRKMSWGYFNFSESYCVLTDNTDVSTQMKV